MTPELTTVSDDDVVLHVPSQEGRPCRVIAHQGLEPDTEYVFEGVPLRTLARPGGELLARVATVNDLHFGETAAGIIAGTDMGPVLRSEPGEEPYPEVMNRAAVADISAWSPDLVVAKGDLTDAGEGRDLQAFAACYDVFGERLVAIPGNHDLAGGPLDLTAPPFGGSLPCAVELPGVIVALLDTTVPKKANGRVGPEQVEWLDELGARADRPVLVMGHHHPWAPGSKVRSDDYFGIIPGDSEALVEAFERRARLAGYFAGHTHRNRVRHFRATGYRPWVEVASVKEFPGAWAEYRVYEGGILQVMRRVGAPDALAWAERTRALYDGTYTAYAFGALEDRCFRVTAAI